MFLGLGITWSTSMALLDGLLHWGGDFARTPKFQLEGQQKTHATAHYNVQSTHKILGEIVLVLYALLAGFLAYHAQKFDLVFFDGLFVIGLLFIICGSTQKRF
jgi:hypothetical protein